MNRTIHTITADLTQKAGEELADTLHIGDVVCLYGDLGAGKTTFTKGVCKGLGINSRVISPTFSLVRQYQFSRDKSTYMFYHIDLYRLESPEDILSIGIKEILNDKSGIVFIEWAEKMEQLLPAKRTEVTITQTLSGRDIQIHYL